MNRLKGFMAAHTRAIVWTLRVVVGATFIISGLSKIFDPWGFVFKIEEYQASWHLDVPRTIDLIGGIGLSAFEFVGGSLLLLGCYRRSVAWLLAACMSVMLPLTLYIWIKDPVSDCGCFGEFWILSNAATFWKNVVLMSMLILLLIYNRRVKGLYNPLIQWVPAFTLLFYAIVLALVSYLVQPLVDFRPYPVGSSLVESEEAGGDGGDIRFIYERDGTTREFSIDDLPGDDWTFVGRTGESEGDNRLAVFDPDTQEDVTDEVLDASGPLLILVISEPARADLSDAYAVNEMCEAVRSAGGEMIALLATSADGVRRWQDLSMAVYDCYTADDTQLKQLARGVTAFVYAEDGVVKWKRSIGSIDLDDINAVVAGDRAVGSLGFNSGRFLVVTTSILLTILAFMLVAQESIAAFSKKISARRSKK